MMEAAGLPTPRNMLVEKPADIEAAAKHVGFPCVIKPISGAPHLFPFFVIFRIHQTNVKIKNAAAAPCCGHGHCNDCNSSATWAAGAARAAAPKNMQPPVRWRRTAMHGSDVAIAVLTTQVASGALPGQWPRSRHALRMQRVNAVQ